MKSGIGVWSVKVLSVECGELSVEYVVQTRACAVEWGAWSNKCRVWSV